MMVIVMRMKMGDQHYLLGRGRVKKRRLSEEVIFERFVKNG